MTAANTETTHTAPDHPLPDKPVSVSMPTPSPANPTNPSTTKKNVLLHIGYEKTGSSAIQAFCARNRGWLKKQGVDYPQIGALPQHSSLYSTINTKDPRRIHSMIRQMRTLVDSSNCPSVVFSHESLHLLSPQVLADMFEGYNTQIVAYLRNPTQAAISHFATMIRFGNFPVDNLPKAIRSYFKTVISCFDYYWELEAFAAAFGRQNLTVRKYSSDSLEGGQSTSDFMHLLKVDQITVSSWPGARANPSIDAEQFLYVSQVARQMRDKPRHRIMKVTRELCNALIEKSPPDRDKPFEMLVRPSLKRAIERYFEPNLQPLYNRYFQGQPVFESTQSIEHPPIFIDPNRLTKFSKILKKSKLVSQEIIDHSEQSLMQHASGSTSDTSL